MGKFNFLSDIVVLQPRSILLPLYGHTRPMDAGQKEARDKSIMYGSFGRMRFDTEVVGEGRASFGFRLFSSYCSLVTIQGAVPSLPD